MTITERRAAKLWAELRQAFARVDQLLPEIIETKAWEPLGFASFTEAWAAKMDGLTLAPELKAFVIYPMFDEGATLDDIQRAVKGVGPRQAEAYKQQKDNGVPPEFATTVIRERKPLPAGKTIVRQHTRKQRSVASTLHIDVGPRRLKRYQKIAKELGKSVEEIALMAIQDRFDELQKVNHA